MGHRIVGGNCRKYKCYGGIVFHGGDISSPSLTLKHSPNSSRTAPVDTTRLPISVLVTLAIPITVSALQSILCRNDLAGRL